MPDTGGRTSPEAGRGWLRRLALGPGIGPKDVTALAEAEGETPRAEQPFGSSRLPRKGRVSGGVAGVSFSVLYLAGNSGLASLPGAPTGSESHEDLARYFLENRGGVLLFAAMVLLSTAFLAWFAYTLRRHLLAVAGSTAAVPGEVVVGAGVAASTIILCAMLLLVSAAERSSGEPLPPDTARTLWDLSNGVGLLFALPAAALTGAVAVVARRAPGSPRWLRSTAPSLAVLLVVIVIAWLSIKLWCLWMVALAISVLRGRDWEPHHTAPDPGESKEDHTLRSGTPLVP